MAIAINRTQFNLLVDDSGSGTDGSIVSKATFDNVVLTPIDNLLNGLNGDLVFSGNHFIRRDTADGSDNGFLQLCGGGASSQTRGGIVEVLGNEHATLPGQVRLYVGNVGGSAFTVLNAAGGAMAQWLGADGSGSFATSRSEAAGVSWVFDNAHASTPSGLRVRFSGSAPNGTGNDFFSAVDSGATRFTVRSNGGIANFQANDVNLSDARMKALSGRPVESQAAAFKRLQFVIGRYEGAPPEDDDITVTAQQVGEIYPELVVPFAVRDVDGAPQQLLGVRTYGLFMRSLKVIQELADRIDALEARP